MRFLVGVGVIGLIVVYLNSLGAIESLRENSFDDSGVGIVSCYDSTTCIGSFAPLEVLLHLNFPSTGFLRCDYAKLVGIDYLVLPYFQELRFQTEKPVGVNYRDTVKLFWNIKRDNIAHPIQVGKIRLAMRREIVKLTEGKQ